MENAQNEGPASRRFPDFVDLRTTGLVATAYDEDHRLLAAHELPQDAVDQSLLIAAERPVSLGSAPTS